MICKYNGFLNSYSRLTERCVDFICTLAMETSCEGCARICKKMNIIVSGDTVIRMLTKRFELQEQPVCGSVVGIDDFAFKKRHRYGTVIIDEATHKPVEILEGRDSETLKKWLRNNQHVKLSQEIGQVLTHLQFKTYYQMLCRSQTDSTYTKIY